MENSCISSDFKSLFPDAVNPYFQTFVETRNLNRRKKNEKRTIMPSGNEMAANDLFQEDILMVRMEVLQKS